ncbi:MFS transporter [Runella sp. SP2]|uniref:MFS transporter n=1 Tax=Runella sp. SP2 TaxID=2268026 RepID=UPI000F07F0D5|nr:MFS transporter [Runella sp. SP2]AYQ31179.1 MFS transporter [Runella sp. SP2]
MKTPTSEAVSLRPLVSLPVIVAALGYFVDVYDLLVFNIVRVPSLKDMGLSPEEVSLLGGKIYNWQQAGLLVGGILWGILADKRGRLSVLFGSIIMYSLANILCGFVQSPDVYALLRFVAGVGLAGELGAGLTLVAEILPQRLRGYGSSIVASVGLLGAVVAFLTNNLFDWRTTYFVGGGLGLVLLLMRVGLLESGMFEKAKILPSKRGSMLSFFTDGPRFWKYMRCIGVGVPTYFVIGIMATYGNEFGAALGVQPDIVAGKCVMYVFIGTVIGDMFSGILSQWLQSRKKAIGVMTTMTLVGISVYLYGGIQTASSFYALCGVLGFSIGYIAMFLTATAESFGTNLRATATSTVANFVRATTLLTLPLFQTLKPSLGVITAGALVATLCFLIGYISLYFMEETFHKNLDYVE